MAPIATAARALRFCDYAAEFAYGKWLQIALAVGATRCISSDAYFVSEYCNVCARTSPEASAAERQPACGIVVLAFSFDDPECASVLRHPAAESAAHGAVTPCATAEQRERWFPCRSQCEHTAVAWRAAAEDNRPDATAASARVQRGVQWPNEHPARQGVAVPFASCSCGDRRSYSGRRAERDHAEVPRRVCT